MLIYSTVIVVQVGKLVIPQAQPSSSHLLPSFLYPPPHTPSTSPGGGSVMLQTCSVPSGWLPVIPTPGERAALRGTRTALTLRTLAHLSGRKITTAERKARRGRVGWWGTLKQPYKYEKRYFCWKRWLHVSPLALFCFVIKKSEKESHVSDEESRAVSFLVTREMS